jgi:hypothetical protein
VTLNGKTRHVSHHHLQTALQSVPVEYDTQFRKEDCSSFSAPLISLNMEEMAEFLESVCMSSVLHSVYM